MEKRLNDAIIKLRDAEIIEKEWNKEKDSLI
jgi:hypothetical protein